MAKTNAERQAAYRARHLHSDDAQGERLNTIVSLHAKRKLERLAACYGVTQRALLEQLLKDAEDEVMRVIDREHLDHADYYDGRLRLPVTP